MYLVYTAYDVAGTQSTYMCSIAVNLLSPTVRHDALGMQIVFSTYALDVSNTVV